MLSGNAVVAQYDVARYRQRKCLLYFLLSVQEGSGRLWDSVKKAAFVIGSGILFLAAFGNSLTW